MSSERSKVSFLPASSTLKTTTKQPKSWVKANKVEDKAENYPVECKWRFASDNKTLPGSKSVPAREKMF